MTLDCTPRWKYLYATKPVYCDLQFEPQLFIFPDILKKHLILFKNEFNLLTNLLFFMNVMKRDVLVLIVIDVKWERVGAVDAGGAVWARCGRGVRGGVGATMICLRRDQLSAWRKPPLWHDVARAPYIYIFTYPEE